MVLLFSPLTGSPIVNYKNIVVCDPSGQNILCSNIATGTGALVSNDYGNSFHTTNFPNIGYNTIPSFISSDGQSIYIMIVNEMSYPNAIYWSTDGGSTYSYTSQSIYTGGIPISYDPSGQYMVVSNILYSSQGDGKTYTSSSGPGGLTLTDIPASGNCIGTSCSNIGTYVVGLIDDGNGYGSIFYSTNGTNFSKVYTHTSNTIYSLIGNSSTGQYVYSCIHGGSILYSHDYGATWTFSDAIYKNYFSLTCDSTGQYVYCITNDEFIYRSTNYGQNWSVTNAISSNWYTIQSTLSGQKILAYGNSHITYSSSNYGLDWEEVSTLPSSDYSDYSPAVSNEGFIVPHMSNVAGHLMTNNVSINKVLLYDSNGASSGTVPIDNSSPYIEGSTVTVLGNTGFLEKAKEVFNGWNTASNGSGMNYLPGDSFVINDDTVLYAQWQRIVCFKEGSTILCLIDEKEVYLPIQNIRKGVLVKTSRNGYVPVHMIGTSKLYNSGNNLRCKHRLYRLSKSNYPILTDDLVVTGCHSILVDELSQTQRENIIEELGRLMVTDNKYRLMAVYDDRAEPYEEGVFNIWNLALENTDIRMNYGIYANGGLLVETTSIRMISEYSGMTIL